MTVDTDAAAEKDLNFPKGVKPSFFKMETQLLEQGRTNTPLCRMDNLWLVLKVYGSGGENGLHTHPDQDHVHLVLQGKARFFGPDGEHRDCGPNEGIVLPAGAFYHFNAISEEPLVILRIGAPTAGSDVNPSGRRLKPDGSPIPADSPDNNQVPLIYKEDAWFK